MAPHFFSKGIREKMSGVRLGWRIKILYPSLELLFWWWCCWAREGQEAGWTEEKEERREERQGGVDKNQRVHRSALFCLLTYLLLLYSFDLMMMSSGDVWDLIRVRNHPSII